MKSRFKIIWPSCALVLAWACVLPTVRAQTATAEATLSETSTEVGQPVEYDIQVAGASGNKEPQTPQVDGLTITPGGRKTAWQMNGSATGGMKIVSTVTYVFNVEPSRAGRFVIPGQEIDGGSAGALRVSPVSLTVTKGDSGSPQNDPARAVFAELTTDKKSAYVGEAISAEVKCYFGARVDFRSDPNMVLNGEGFTAQKFQPPRQDVQSVEGSKFRVMTYRTVLAGAKTGTLSIGPAETDAIVQLPRNKPRSRSSFSNPFEDDPFFRDPFGAFNDTVTKQIKLRTDPQPLEIKPLPPGAPADFNGAVGHFSLEAEADQKKVQSGDPVKVRVHISGDGNFDRVSAPALSDEQGLRAYPPSASFKADDALGLNGTKTFEQEIVPQGGRKAFPGYHFSYFDPDTAKYVSLQTQQLGVTVEGAPAPTVTPTPTPTAPAAAPTPAAKPKDILYIRTDAGPAASFTPAYKQRLFWIVQGMIAALFAVVAALTLLRTQARNEKRRQMAATQRQQADLLKALQGERTPRRDFYSAAARLAQLKAGAFVGRPGAHLSAAEICAAKSFDPQTTASVQDIFHRHDELAYSGGAAAEEPVASEERRTVLNTLEIIG